MWKKISGLLLFVIALIAGSGYLYMPTFVEEKMHAALKRADSVSFSNINIDLSDGNFHFTHFYIKDTSGALFQHPTFAKLRSIKLVHIDMLKLLIGKKIDVEEVLIGPGQLNITFDHLADSSNTYSTPIPKRFSTIEIAHLKLDSLAVALNFSPTDTHTYFQSLVNFESFKLHIPTKDMRAIEAENMRLNLANVKAHNNKGITRYSIENVSLNKGTKSLRFGHIQIRQLLARTVYERFFGYDKLHFELDVDSVAFRELEHMNQFFDQVHIPRIDIYSPFARLAKDKRFYHKKHARKFPFEPICNLDFPLQIDTISMHNGTLFFKENSRDDGKTANINLFDVDAQISNVTSQGANDLGQFTTISANLNFYRKLPIQFNWKFDLKTNGTSFVFDGTFGQAPLAVFNPFLLNKADIRFKQGELLGGHLRCEANKTSGEGTLEFYYKDLKVEWFTNKEHQQDFGHNLLGSATNLLVRNNNKPNSKAKLGIVYAVPQKDRFVLAYLWRLMASGMKDIVLNSSNENKAANRPNQYIEP